MLTSPVPEEDGTPFLSVNSGLDLSAITFLKAEWRRLVFEQETKRKAYFSARQDIQSAWDKLSNLRAHIERISQEFEEAKVEVLSQEADRRVLQGEIEAIQEGLANVTVRNANRAGTIRVWKEKLRQREALQAKVVLIEQRLEENRRNLVIQSQVMKDCQQNLVIRREADYDNMSAEFVAKSMAARTELLLASKNVNELEVDLMRSSTELEALNAELKAQAAELNSPDRGVQGRLSLTGGYVNLNGTDGRRTPATSSATGAGGAASAAPADIYSSAEFPNRSDVMEIISNGEPFSKNLSDALLSGQFGVPERTIIPEEVEASMLEMSLDEVLGKHSQLYRMNGELLQVYMYRLQRRLNTLKALEVGVVRDFLSKLKTLKLQRDQMRDVEVKRLRVEVQLSRYERYRQGLDSGPLSGTSRPLPPTVMAPPSELTAVDARPTQLFTPSTASRQQTSSPDRQYQQQRHQQQQQQTSSPDRQYQQHLPQQQQQQTSSPDRQYQQQRHQQQQQQTSSPDRQYHQQRHQQQQQQTSSPDRQYQQHLPQQQQQQTSSPDRQYQQQRQQQQQQQQAVVSNQRDDASSGQLTPLDGERNMHNQLRSVLKTMTREGTDKSTQKLIDEEKELLNLIGLYLEHRERMWRAHDRSSRQVELKVLSAMLQRDLGELNEAEAQELMQSPAWMPSNASPERSSGIPARSGAGFSPSSKSNRVSVAPPQPPTRGEDDYPYNNSYDRYGHRLSHDGSSQHHLPPQLPSQPQASPKRLQQQSQQNAMVARDASPSKELTAVQTTTILGHTETPERAKYKYCAICQSQPRRRLDWALIKSSGITSQVRKHAQHVAEAEDGRLVSTEANGELAYDDQNGVTADEAKEPVEPVEDSIRKLGDHILKSLESLDQEDLMDRDREKERAQEQEREREKARAREREKAAALVPRNTASAASSASPEQFPRTTDDYRMGMFSLPSLGKTAYPEEPQPHDMPHRHRSRDSTEEKSKPQRSKPLAASSVPAATNSSVDSASASPALGRLKSASSPARPIINQPLFRPISGEPRPRHDSDDRNTDLNDLSSQLSLVAREISRLNDRISGHEPAASATTAQNSSKHPFDSALSHVLHIIHHQQMEIEELRQFRSQFEPDGSRARLGLQMDAATGDGMGGNPSDPAWNGQTFAGTHSYATAGPGADRADEGGYDSYSAAYAANGHTQYPGHSGGIGKPGNSYSAQYQRQNPPQQGHGQNGVANGYKKHPPAPLMTPQQGAPQSPAGMRGHNAGGGFEEGNGAGSSLPSSPSNGANEEAMLRLLNPEAGAVSFSNADMAGYYENDKLVCTVAVANKLASLLQSKHGKWTQRYRELTKAQGPDRMTANFELEIVQARHLPVMKRMTRTSDPYVELVLLEIVAHQGPVERVEMLEMLSHLKDAEYNILSGDCSLCADCPLDSLEKQYGLSIRVLSYQRTSVQNGTCYPQWRESVQFNVLNEKNDLLLWVLVRDAAKVSHSLKIKDEIIAQSSLFLSSFFLTDVQSHRIMLPLHMPHPQRWLKGRARLHEKCALSLTVQAVLSPAARMAAQLAETERLLESLALQIADGAEMDSVSLDEDVRRRLHALLSAADSVRTVGGSLFPEQSAPASMRSGANNHSSSFHSSFPTTAGAANGASASAGRSMPAMPRNTVQSVRSTDRLNGTTSRGRSGNVRARSVSPHTTSSQSSRLASTTPTSYSSYLNEMGREATGLEAMPTAGKSNVAAYGVSRDSARAADLTIFRASGLRRAMHMSAGQGAPAKPQYSRPQPGSNDRSAQSLRHTR